MQTLNLRLTRDDSNCSWGFLLQGGYNTEYPLSIQRVFSSSPAEGILQKNDKVNMINNICVENVSVKEAEELLSNSESHLEIIVERNFDTTNKQETDEHDENKSVKEMRMKFLNDDCKPPQPFGNYEIPYINKFDAVPKSSVDNSLNLVVKKKIDNQKPNTIDENDRVDYSFNTLPVRERKKFFNIPNENMSSKTMSKLRSQSFRNTRTYGGEFPKVQTRSFSKKPQDHGWETEYKKIEKSLHYNQNETIPLRNQEKKLAPRNYNKYQPLQMENKYLSEYPTVFKPVKSPGLYSNSKTIPSSNRQRIYSTLNTFGNELEDDRKDSFHGQTKYIYHCGKSNVRNLNEPSTIFLPSAREQQSINVNNTYNISRPTVFSEDFPQHYKPAYSVYSSFNPSQSVADNWSVSSVYSEPHWKRNAKTVVYEKVGTYGINRDPVYTQRDFHSNKHVPNEVRQFQNNSLHESPTIRNSRQSYNLLTVTKPQSHLDIGPIQISTNVINTQGPWYHGYQNTIIGDSEF